MITNFDVGVGDEYGAVELLSLGHVKRCTATLLGAPTSTDERVTHNDVVLVVSWIDVQRRVTCAVVWAHTQIH